MILIFCNARKNCIQLISQSHIRFELANQSHFCRTAKRSKQMHDQLGAKERFDLTNNALRAAKRTL
jgi:hypothetical protein